MEPIILTDVNPLLLSCKLDDNHLLHVYYENQELTDGEILVELDALTSTQVAVADFAHNGMLYRVNVASIHEDGLLTAWQRDTTSALSTSLAPGESEHIEDAVITAVSYGYVEATSASVSLAAPRQATQCQIRVRVPRSGSRPT